MRVSRLHLWLCSGYLAVGVLGCHHHHPHEQTVYVEPQPSVAVVQMPPAVIVEPRPYSPGGNYRWVEGYWAWRGDRYVWQRGYWVVPPRGYREWVPPRYEPYGRGYRYTPGYWRR